MKNKYFLFLLAFVVFGGTAVLNFQYASAGIFDDCPSGYEEEGGLCIPSDLDITGDSVLEIMADVLKWLLYFVGALSVMLVVYSGLLYIMSAGDEKKTDTAKDTLKSALIGLAIALLSLVIINTIIRIVE